MLPLLERRTRLAFDHPGIYITETHTLFGAYDPCDYGTAAADRPVDGVPYGYQMSPWIRFDFGGDGGLPELCMMLLDHYLYTLDNATLRRYYPLLNGTLAFFYHHYGASSAAEKLRIFPTQALETYQCPGWPPTLDACPLNDHPTVAALHVLTERALGLPAEFGSPFERAQWQALRAALPDLPMAEEDGQTVVAPYEGYPQPNVSIRNSETAELYSTHPFRLLTLASSRKVSAAPRVSLDGELSIAMDQPSDPARLIRVTLAPYRLPRLTPLPSTTPTPPCRFLWQSGAAHRDIAPSLYCLEQSKRETCRNADANTGWTQGVLNAALLGRAAMASRMVLERSQTTPAAGYRFPAFMPHLQDYEPSEDHLANLNTALQLMLLAPADDQLEAGGVLLFPAWPCSWDVDFRLAAPRQTFVSAALVNGTLVRLDVDPPERKNAVIVLPCQDV